MCTERISQVAFGLVLVLALTGTLTADITTALASHWMLDDQSGLVATDSVGGNDGTLQGDATWAEGYLGGAVLLDGNGDYIDCGNNESFNITDAVTLAAWVQAQGDFSYPDWSGIIMRGGPNIDTFALYYNRPGQQIGFKTTGTNPNWFATNSGTAAALFDGSWHHVAATYDGKTKVVYLDGAVVGSMAATGKIETSTGRVLLGAGRDLNPPTHYVAGRIDDARIYSRGLAANDVKELIPPKLQAYEPTPANGAVGVLTPLFMWKAGDTALFHNVYLGKEPNLGPADLVAPSLVLAMHWHVPGLEPGVTYYWRVDEIEVDGATIHTGNVWSFVAQALTAYRPEPADGAVDASPAPALTWLPGQTAVKHHVYFSSSFDDVNDGAAQADKGAIEETRFAPGDLAATATYYWRVDEIVATGEVRRGPVWTFTTHLPVDDFESYTDEIGERIFQTWIDGFGYTEPVVVEGNGTGSTVGNTEPPFAEQTVVHGGLQSMPLEYNNADAPWYSEAERRFDTAQDWTVNGVNTLVLHVRGRTGNDATQVYVALQDMLNRTAAVAHPDPNIVTMSAWTQWKIPVSEFSADGVNLAAVRKIYVGLGDRDNPVPDGAGRIYIDDIYLIESALIEPVDASGDE